MIGNAARLGLMAALILGLQMPRLCAGEEAGAPLDKKVEDLEARLKALEAAKGAPATSAAAKPWYERLKLSGDFRYRHMTIDKEGADNRDGDRIRARLALDAAIGDGMDVRLRLATSPSKTATGGGDPDSANVALSGGASKKDVRLDQAFLNYHPAAAKGLSILAGKMDVPFYRPGESDLIWDGDLTPEGGAVKYSPQFGDLQLLSSVGGFWLSERDTAADGGIFGANLALKLNVSEEQKAYVLGGAGYYDYVRTKGFALYDWQGANNSYGNTKTGANYRFDYDEAEFFLEAGAQIYGAPASLFADVVHNARAEDDNLGFLVGFSVGELKRPRDVKLSYNYRDLEKDAVVGAFTDSDSFGGGTDGRGHKVAVDFLAVENVSLGAACYVDEVNVSTNDQTADKRYNRYQIDICLKF